jgi:hypothetical protein
MPGATTNSTFARFGSAKRRLDLARERGHVYDASHEGAAGRRGQREKIRHELFHRLAGLGDAPKHIAPVRVELAAFLLLEHRRESLDPMQGCPQIVRDRVIERLELLVRSLELRVFFVQRLFDRLPFSDVPDGACDERSIARFHGSQGHLDGKLGRVLAPGMKLEPEGRLDAACAGEQSIKMLARRCPMPVGDEDVHRSARELAGRVTEQPIGLRVAKPDEAGRIDDQDRVGHRLEDVGEAGIERPLEGIARRDVHVLSHCRRAGVRWRTVSRGFWKHPFRKTPTACPMTKGQAQPPCRIHTACCTSKTHPRTPSYCASSWTRCPGRSASRGSRTRRTMRRSSNPRRPT